MVLASGLMFGACGGKSDGVASGGTAADGAPTDQGGGMVRGTHSPGCPETQPTLQSPCTTDGIRCEYGDDFNPSCNAQLDCSVGTWGSQGQAGSGCPTSGPPIDPPPPPNGPECPASTPSGACTGATSCHYGPKLETACACGPICSQYPISHCEDAGVDWRCNATPPGSDICPVPRPRLGEPCSAEGDSCRVGPAHQESCEEARIVCQSGKWGLNIGGCPISSARHKKNIQYVDDAAKDALAQDLLAVRLATYEYRPGVSDGAKHLGFIIEDQPPGSPAVLGSRERVDLYGYVSMAVNAIQVQQKEIETLRRQVAELEARQPRR
jgi:Chaperone of endosialidase